MRSSLREIVNIEPVFVDTFDGRGILKKKLGLSCSHEIDVDAAHPGRVGSDCLCPKCAGKYRQKVWSWSNKALAIVIGKKLALGIAFGRFMPIVLLVCGRALINRTFKLPIWAVYDKGTRFGFRGLRSQTLRVFFGPGAGYMNPITKRRGATFYVAIKCTTPLARRKPTPKRSPYYRRLLQIGITRNANAVPFSSH